MKFGDDINLFGIKKNIWKQFENFSQFWNEKCKKTKEKTCGKISWNFWILNDGKWVEERVEKLSSISPQKWHHLSIKKV